MFPRHTSISIRVIFALVLATTLLMLAAGWVADREVHRVLQTDLGREHAARTEQLAVALTLPVWNLDRDQILRVLDAALLQEFVVQVEVRLADRNATRLARTRLAGAAPTAGRVLAESRPIRFEQNTLGTVELQITTAPMVARLQRFRAWMVAFGLTVDAGLIAALSILLWRSVLRPLREIERFAASPDLAAPTVNRSYRGELESLRASLLAMIGDLRLGETRLRMIGDNLPDTMVYQVARGTDGTMRFVHLSAGVERIHQVSPADALRDPTLLYRQILEEDRPQLTAAEAASFAHLTVFQAEVRLRRPDGSVRWVSICSQPRRLPDGTIVWDGLERDITASKLADDERLRLGRMIEANDDAACWTDSSNRIVYANAAMLRAVGHTRGELIGSHVSLISPHSTPARLEQVWATLRREGSHRAETIHRRRDGATFPVEISGTLCVIDGQEFYCGFARDISARHASELEIQRQLEELRRWQSVTLKREERIGQLKAEVNSLCEAVGQPVRYQTAAAPEHPAGAGRETSP